VNSKLFLFILSFLFFSFVLSYVYADDFSNTFTFKTETTLYQLNTSSPLNPNNILNLPYSKTIFWGKTDLGFSILDFHFNFTPYLNSYYQTSDQKIISDLLLSSGFLVWDLGDFSFHFGKEVISWGTAYAWNPTNFFVSQRDFQNLNVQKIGIQAFQAYYYLGHNFTFTTVGVLDDSRFSSGAKFYGLIYDMDLNFSLYGGENKKTTAGFSMAKIFGDALEVHGEIAAQNESNLIKLVIGGQYTTLENTNIILEYYHQNKDLDLTQEVYQLATLKQNYLFIRIAQPDFWDQTDVHVMGFYNMDDQGSVLIPELIYQLNASSNLYINAALLLGSTDSEFRSFYDHTLTLGAEIFF